MSPYRVKLHSKTPSQFHTQLLTLNHKFSHGQAQLEQMQKGNGLFGLVEEDKKKKVRSAEYFFLQHLKTSLQRLEEEAKQYQDQDARFKNWKEAEVATDIEITIEKYGNLLSLEYAKTRERSSDARRRG